MHTSSEQNIDDKEGVCHKMNASPSRTIVSFGLWPIRHSNLEPRKLFLTRRDHSPVENICLAVIIPDVLIPIILSYCDAKTLSRAACVCREWFTMSSSNMIWDDLCRKKFGIAANQLTPPPDPTKLLYILAYCQLREAMRQDQKKHETSIMVRSTVSMMLYR
mmetsp:Transcript_1915/g.2829  ORF Transcript_1915/g.2829 Transcript_1915/m.2829 type:complete len:162 (-) Transcript_1915:1103-1588(-)